MPSSETLQQALSKWWVERFEDFQSQEDDDSADVEAVAARLVKEVQLLQVNHGLQSMNMEETDAASASQSASSILSLLWKEIFIPACLAAEGNDAFAVSKQLLALMCAVGRQLEIASDIAEIALNASESAIDNVRALGCHMLGHLNQVEALIPRLTDKAISVRAAAIAASGVALEHQEDTELVEALLWNVWHEPSVPNRVLALQALPASEQVWDHVIARLRDVKEKVRLAAIGILRGKISSLEQLSSTQLAAIVQSSIGVIGSHAGPRCQATKDATTELICAHWMKLSKFNTLNLLQSIDVVANEEEAEQVIRVVLQVAENAQEFLSTLSPPEKRAFQVSISSHLVTLSEENASFTPEQFLLARVAASQNESYLSKIVPDMGVLCDTFQQFSVKDGDQSLFICLQLLQMATVVGLGEEGSRRRFASLLQAVLTTSPEATIPDELIEACTIALMKLQQGQMDPFSEIIGTLKAASVDDQLLSPICNLRILSILSIVLEEAKVTFSMRDFLQTVSGTVQDAVSSEDNILREAGVACLAKVGLFSDKDVVVRAYKPLLLNVAANEDEKLTIRSQAIMALADWALVFEEILQASETGVTLNQVLLSLLGSEHSSVAAIAAESTAKLLFAGRLYESALVSHLLVLFFDLNTQNASSSECGSDIGSTARMQQWLSLFFPAFCLQSKLARDCVLGAIESALKSGASRKSFPVVKLVEYVCEVVAVAEEEVAKDQPSGDEGEAKEEDEDSYMALKIALQVAPFILHVLVEEEQVGKKCITLTLLRGLCKLLGSLEVDGPVSDLVQLRETMEELAMMLTDPTSLKALNDLTSDLAQVKEEEAEEGGEESVVTGRESNASTITEDSAVLNKENATKNAAEGGVTKTGRPSSDSTVLSTTSSRVTRRSAALRTSTENSVF